MRPMVTNGGSHPADKWADITVDQILDLVQITDDSVTPEAAAARQTKRDLRPALFAILNTAIASTQSAERALPKGIRTPEQARAHAFDLKVDNAALDGLLAQVTAAIAPTSFGDHFAKPETQAVVRTMIGQSLADVMHIERRYHHDRLTVAATGA